MLRTLPGFQLGCRATVFTWLRVTNVWIKISRDYKDALIENLLTYDGTFGKHHINVVAGQTYEEENTDLVERMGIEFH